MASPDPAPASRGQVRAEGGRWLAGAAAGAMILVAIHLLAARTRAGQAMENAALRGADRVAEQDFAATSDWLGANTIVSLGGLIVLVAVLSSVRRRIDLALAGVGAIVLGQGSHSA